MSTNSLEIVFRNGNSTKQAVPLIDSNEEIQSVAIVLGWTTVAVSKRGSSLEVLLDDQHPPRVASAPGDTNCTEDDAVEINVVAAADDEVEQGTDRDQPRSSTSAITEQYTREARGLLMVLATLFLQMAYQAAANPPGGFWQDDLSSATQQLAGGGSSVAAVPHRAGDPIIRDKFRSCYVGFAWLNALALACSSFLILFLLAQPLFRSRQASHPRWPTLIMYVNLVLILAAYTTGAVTKAELMISLIPIEVVSGMSVVILYIYTEGKIFSMKTLTRIAAAEYLMGWVKK
ncbi:uncharacterized protein LOC121986879 [Zingiber officinale]|uniref:uncharacterized protein LOC121986879 n=1 Tax=Zingiber officinale TaxID=94328 RepID=UPI001C4B6B56|nr:uncharacterized protein LOC121986879 [Zingiber officinale]